MLTESHNKTLPLEPHEKGPFKERLLQPVAHIAKAGREWLVAAMKAPLQATVIVLATAGAISGRPFVLTAAVIVAILVYLNDKNHALCLRSPDSTPR
jgi:hypothetical protein